MSDVLPQTDVTGGDFSLGAVVPPSANPAPQHEIPLAKPPRPGFEHLPSYTRSLLRIKLPVMVTLAEKRQPLSRIVEIGPGSIIQFDKSCEEMLELSVGGHPVAYGEAVKVGDKFGLRIHSIKPQDERFHPLGTKPS